jgi:DNA-binding beta-propeller fold protein YncE
VVDWCYNPTMNRLYCITGRTVSVIDCTVDSIVARVTLPEQCYTLCCAPAENKVYCPMPTAEEVAVIDCLGDSILSTFYTGVGQYQMLYNHLSNRLYISEQGDEDVTIVDCARDSVVRWIAAGYQPGKMCLGTRQNRVYVADEMGDMFAIIDGAGDSLIGWRRVDWPQTEVVYDSTDDVIYAGLRYMDSLLVYDCRGDTAIGRIGIPNRDLYGLAWAERENRVYAANYLGRVRVWEGGTREVVTDHDLWCELSGAVWRTAADELYGAETGSGFAVIDPEQGRVVRRVPLPRSEHLYVAYNPQVDKLYCGRSQDLQGELLVVRCAERDSVVTVPGVTARADLFAFDPARPRTWCAWHYDSTLHVLDAAADTLVRRLSLGGTPLDVEFAPDLDRVFVAVPGERSVLIYDAAAESLVGGIDVRLARDLLYVPGWQYLCVYDQGTGHFRVFDATTGRQLSAQLMSSSIRAMHIDGSAGKVYFGSAGRNALFILDLGSLQFAATGLPFDVLWLVSDAVRHRLYVGSGNGQGIGVVDTRDDRLLTTLDVTGVTTGTWDPVRQRLLLYRPGGSELTVVEDTTLVGVREAPGVGIGRGRLATHVRGVLSLQPTTGSRSVLLDAAGRKVLDLKAGDNDVSRLSPGVYFVRTRGQGAKGEGPGEKVVITR